MNLKRIKKSYLIGGIIFVLLVGLFTTLYLLNRPQDVRQRASGPVCPVDGASCEWGEVQNATSYHYKIVEAGETEKVIKEGDTTQRLITFTAEAGKTYKCTVTASNACGTGGPGMAENTCAIPSLTPTFSPTPSSTPSATPSVSPTASPTITITPTASPTITPTPKPSSTPTPSPTSTPTPTPTSTPIPTPTNTPIPTPSPIPSPTPIPTTPPVAQQPPSQQQSQPTPTTVIAKASPPPSLPPTGSLTTTIGIIAGVILSIVGGILLFTL